MGILRVLLALAVLYGHLPGRDHSNVMFGADAVRIFFAISGFYMAMILNGKYSRARDFYLSRYLRLYPAYFVVIALTGIWFVVVTVYTNQKPPPFWIYDSQALAPWWQWALIRFANLTMIGLDLPSLFYWHEGVGFVFSPAQAGMIQTSGWDWAQNVLWIGQAWSVGTEIWFYLLAPFLVVRAIWIQVVVGAVSLGIMIAISLSDLDPYFIFPANLWLFIVGSLLYRALPRLRPVADRAAWVPFALVLVLWCTLGLAYGHWLHWPLVMAVILCMPLIFLRFAKLSWDRSLGNLSYGLYLVHALVISALRAVFHLDSAVVAGLISLAVAALIAFFIEAPVDRFRQTRVAATAQVRQGL